MRTFIVLQACLVSLLAALAFSASSASAQSPWWHLNSTQRPSNLHGTPVNEVQELVMEPVEQSGKKEAGFELYVGGKFVNYFLTEPIDEENFGNAFPAATAAEVQKALEGTEFYGPGNVQVTGGPAPDGTLPSGAKEVKWVVTTVGQDTGVPVTALVANPIGFGTGLERTGGIFEPIAQVAVQARAEGQLVLTVSNLGDATVLGATSPVKVTDTLPPGLRPLYISGEAGEGQAKIGARGALSCPTSAEVQEGKPLTCTFPGQLPPYEHLELVVGVIVEDEALAAEGHNQISVSGGEGYTCDSVGAGRGSFTSRGCLPEEGKGVEPGGGFERASTGPISGASLPFPLRFGTPGFGVEAYELTNESEGGALDSQAGSHPFQQTTTIFFKQTAEGKPVALPKDLHFKWPAGLVGNPTPLLKCTLGQFLTITNSTHFENACPADTQVGVAVSTINGVAVATGLTALETPLFNVEPSQGEPARFGFYVPGAPVFIDPSVRDGEDYGITVNADNITQVDPALASQVTVWGVPGEPVHDPERGFGCLYATRGVFQHEESTPACTPQEQAHPPSFLAMPSACPVNSKGEPEATQSIVEGDSWLEPGHLVKVSTSEPSVSQRPMPALDGCNKLPFEPSIVVKPDLQSASSSSGLTVDVHVPQEESLNAGGLSEADPRTITVALPGGVAVNPSGGDGLEACSEGLVGFERFEELATEPGVNGAIFTPKLPGSFGTEGEFGELKAGVNFCPNASKIGEATVHTPLLPDPIAGFIYLASQNQNPFGSLLAMYIVAEDQQSGVTVKLAGQVGLCKSAGEQLPAGEDPTKLTCQTPGQLIATFENSPQAPFEDAILHFFGGERAPLATPAHCGAYTTRAAFTPWSAEEGEAPHTSTSTFDITSGPNGTPCPGASLPFHPTLTGGALNVNAGVFSPFTATMSRKDGEQNLQSLEVHLPPGLSGILTGVELCPEPQANLGECGANSLIGETTVSVGVGGDPFSVRGGKFYLTGPYNGTGSCKTSETGCAPFGITFEVPAKAGPFDLRRNSANPAGENPCDCVLVRGKIEVNPVTAAITITSNPPGTPDAIPTSIEGIPLEIQHVNAITTRNDFQFNPTNCNKMEVTGTIHSSEGTTDTIGVPFQVTNCAVLGFKPGFKISTSGKTSRANGASLNVKLTYPKAPFGSQANIKSVKVDLPRQLPSRLTTLQKACTAAQFEANPAGCPAASIVGHATAITPLIPVPLTGPAYFVSYGGAKFPELVIVLQGYGVTLDLHGETFISKAGITSSTFRTVPDAPVGSFELNLPEGKYSALAANGNLCAAGRTVLVNKHVKVRSKGHTQIVTRKVRKTISGLVMPTAFTAQNGAVIHENTPIGVTGCARHKAKRRRRARRAAHARHRHG